MIDNNSLIDAQTGKVPESGLAFLKDAINDYFTISFITYIEFLGYRDVTIANKDFIAMAIVIEIDKEIINACIELRKTHRIKLPDAIIAATALVKDLTIITNNEKDFESIKGLKFINLYKFQV